MPESVNEPLRLAGDVDISNVPELRDRIQDHAAATAGDVVLDCSGLRFIDSIGISALLTEQGRLRQQGRTLRLTDVGPGIKRVLDVAGVLDVLC